MIPSIKKGLAAALIGVLSSPVLAQTPNSLDALLQRSSELLAERQMQAAVDLLEAQRSTYPQSVELLNNLAIAYLGTGQFDQAQQMLRDLVDEDAVYRIIAHNLVELESSAGGTQPIDPLLFVQSASSWSHQEVAATPAAPTSQEVALRAPEPVAEPSPRTPYTSQPSESEVQRMVENWRNAWVNGNLSDYLSFYSAEFTPRSGSYQDWRADRAEKLQRAGDLSIEVGNFDISIYNNEIRARFDQRYESTDYRDRVRKLLVIDNPDGEWRIVREATLEVYEIY